MRHFASFFPIISMKMTRLFSWVVSSTALLLVGNVAWGQLVISMDMDTAMAGIQSSRTASPGDIFDVGLVFDLTGAAGGLSSYGVSVQFKNAKLTLNGVPVTSAATEPLPVGYSFNISPGVSGAANDIGGGIGNVLTFEAATFGLGPSAGTFTAGLISFKVSGPPALGGVDITPGLFNTGVDGLFDNSSAALSSVVFNSGSLSVVPESTGIGVTFAGLLLTWGVYRRCRTRIRADASSSLAISH